MSALNPDYTSEIKLGERFHLDNGLCLLTMFEKKVDTFIKNSKTLTSIREKKQDYYDEQNILSEEAKESDPLQQLAKDLTKPIWKCVTKVQPYIIYTKYSVMEPLQPLNQFSKIFNCFINRYKNQHEDEGCFRMHLKAYNSEDQVMRYQLGNKTLLCEMHAQIESFMNLLGRYSEIELEKLPKAEVEEVEFSKMVLCGIKQIAKLYLNNGDQSFSNELDIFNMIVVKNLKEVLDGNIGALIICLQPKIKYLPLIVHPLLMSLYLLFKDQQNQAKRRQEQRNRKKETKIKEEEVMEEQPSFLFEEFKGDSCSKVVFINLDGYESQFNLNIAKYLGRNLMYISYPREGFNQNVNNPSEAYERWRSEYLLRKYYQDGLTPEQKKQMNSLYEMDEKAQKKNLFMFPVYSKSLHEKKYLGTIQDFQSAFIAFTLKEILIQQILHFNPSIIVVSYSQKLSIQKQVFLDLMKQLTILANYRVVFYYNVVKNYMFEEIIDEEFTKDGLKFWQAQKSYYQKYQQNMKYQRENGQINPELFEKVGIATKVISGTYNLDKQEEEESFVEKFKNYKVIQYASKLLKTLESQLPSLFIAKMKVNEYSTISKVLHNYFYQNKDPFDKLFNRVLAKYHKNAIMQAEKVIFGEKIQDQSLIKLRCLIDKELDSLRKKQVWENLKFQYSLQVSTSKTRTHYFVHIPKYKEKSEKQNNLIGLEFEIVLQKQKYGVELDQASKLYFDKERKHKNALVYLINHLHNSSAPRYSSYYGKITPQFDKKYEQKLQISPVEFKNSLLEPYETYTEFNYMETNNYIFMFWPKVFNLVKYLLHRLLQRTYTAQCTKIFFRAYRNNPSIFEPIPISNSSYKEVIPRYGCKCYEVNNTNHVYIFGGFYSDEKNYLQFQTDITHLHYTESEMGEEKIQPKIMIENIGKEFFFQGEKNQNRGTRQMKVIKNDFVRPRLQYQVIEGKGEVYLIGGIGQNFQRPYSLIGYMGHRLKFNQETGQLLHISRIKMNNVVPVNLAEPVKVREPSMMTVVQNFHNRDKTLSHAQTTYNSESMCHHAIRYIQQEEKFVYETQYNLGEMDAKSYRDEVQDMKKGLSISHGKNKWKLEILRGKEFKTNIIFFSGEQERREVCELHLQLSLEVIKNTNLNPIVNVTGSSIKAIDQNKNTVYAIINHCMYTMGEYILAYLDMNELPQHPQLDSFVLKQLYKFSHNICLNTLIIPKPNMIAIVHGHKFDESIEIPELLLKRTKTNKIKQFSIKQNPQYCKQLMMNTKKSVNKINCSFFINQNNGKIFCLSFKTIERISKRERILMVIERLNLISSEAYQWEKVAEKVYDFFFADGCPLQDNFAIINTSLERQELSDVYIIVLLNGTHCYEGQIQPMGSTDIIFENLGQTEEQFRRLNQKSESIILEKQLSSYNELRGLYEESRMM